MAKAVKLHRVSPHMSEAGYMGEEPTWNGDTYSLQVTEKNYKSMLIKGMNWYNYVADVKNYRLFMEEFANTYRPTTATKDIERLNRLGDKDIPNSYATIARMRLKGFPLNAEDMASIHTFIEKLQGGKRKRTTTVEVVRPTVHDRIKLQVQGVLSEIDSAVDGFLLDGVALNSDGLRDQIFNPSFKSPHLSYIEKHIKKYLDEWQETIDAMEGKFRDETSVQLLEGYHYTGLRALRKIVAVFAGLIGTVSTQSDKIRVTRIRKRKPVDKKKMVAKLKFLQTCKETGLTSISPLDILECSTLWVYDCKKRKLGFYTGSMYVKGTTIMGIGSSEQKTLRKPKEQMGEFMKLRKNQTTNFFNAIRAVAQPLKGRTNDQLILLRADT